MVGENIGGGGGGRAINAKDRGAIGGKEQTAEWSCRLWSVRFILSAIGAD